MEAEGLDFVLLIGELIKCIPYDTCWNIYVGYLVSGLSLFKINIWNYYNLKYVCWRNLIACKEQDIHVTI